MSSNFYTSTHNSYWLVTRTTLSSSRALDLQYASARHLSLLSIYFSFLLSKVGRRMNLRQIVLGTATVYFKRFYTKNSLCETNPYVVLVACLYVAAKVEETPVHIKQFVAEAKVALGEAGIKGGAFGADAHRLGEMEFYLVEDLDFHLAVFHPYRALLAIAGREPVDAGRFDRSRKDEADDMARAEAEARKRADDDAKRAGRVADEYEIAEAERIRRLMGRGTGEGFPRMDDALLQLAWVTINDTYRTDVHLLYPPHIIALSALYIALMTASLSHSSSSSSSAASAARQPLPAPPPALVAANAALALPPPPAAIAAFFASFQVSLPTFFACVQEIICLYPLWEHYEASQKGLVSEDRFGPEEAEVLVRRMIEQRAADVGQSNETASKKRAR
ncbi:RNA polymerase II holoenzyme cyclin-like subunit [Cryptotrichosporon argae]